jgi:hypothetical protein
MFLFEHYDEQRCKGDTLACFYVIYTTALFRILPIITQHIFLQVKKKHNLIADNIFSASV